MTKTTIMSIIKAHNKNKDIKWDVAENKQNKIVLINDYDNSIHYEIVYEKNNEGETIIVKNKNCWKPIAACLFNDNRFLHDFNTKENGMIRGVISAVKHFYYFY